MRLHLIVCLAVSFSALAQNKAAAPSRHPVAVFPPSAEGEAGSALAHLVQARASTLLERGGKHSCFHAKQIVAMAEAENLPVPRFAEADVATLDKVKASTDAAVEPAAGSSETMQA